MSQIYLHDKSRPVSPHQAALYESSLARCSQFDTISKPKLSYHPWSILARAYFLYPKRLAAIPPQKGCPMARRKKYPKLPNGFGSIKYLGKGRRNPYAVHPPTKEFNENGIPQTPKALCYVDTWMKGFMVLTAYKAGNYHPGYEKTLPSKDTDDLNDLAQVLLADYSRIKGAEAYEKAHNKTFAQVYEEFYAYKFETDRSRSYSAATQKAMRTAYGRCKPLHDRIFRTLRYDDLQGLINGSSLGHASLEQTINLLHQMFVYGELYEYTDKDHSRHLKINIPDADEHGFPFSDEELDILWANHRDADVGFILIMCYSGFRISAYKDICIDMEAGYFKGGIKTRSSKERIVPIHHAILPLVQERLERDGCLLTSDQTFRKHMRKTMARLKLPDHTPHDARHTFSKLCEKYRVNENDRRRLLGHSFGKDITNGVYGHRDLEDLRAEIEKIETPEPICY